MCIYLVLKLPVSIFSSLPLPHDFPEQTKTLMFFDGCPQHLGCTIKLRGAGEYELARVKEILIFMICVAYHSQLEISFLMDEFAMPPMLAKNGSLLSPSDKQWGDENGHQNVPGREPSVTAKDVDVFPDKLPIISELVSSDDINALEQKILTEDDSGDLAGHLPVDLTTAATFSPMLVPEPLLALHLGILESDQLDSLQDLGSLQEPKSHTRVFRDPLQDDTGLYITEEVTSSEDRLKSLSLAFQQELQDVILCISPIITFPEPFLLTERGMRCPTREYFPEQVFLSPLLNKECKELEGRRKKQLLRDICGLQAMNGSTQAKPLQILPPHELVVSRIAEPLSSSRELATMLSDYRARGGRIAQKSSDPFVQPKEAPGTKAEDSERGFVQSESLWAHKVSEHVSKCATFRLRGKELRRKIVFFKGRCLKCAGFFVCVEGNVARRVCIFNKENRIAD